MKPRSNLLFNARKRSCGKVMFLHLSVCTQGRGWLPSMHHRSHDQGGLHPDGEGSASRGGSASHPEMICIQRGGSASRGAGQTPRPTRTRKAGGMHPTGIFSCCNCFYTRHWHKNFSTNSNKTVKSNSLMHSSTHYPLSSRRRLSPGRWSPWEETPMGGDRPPRKRHRSRQLPTPVPGEQNDWQTLLKTLPFPCGQ